MPQDLFAPIDLFAEEERKLVDLFPKEEREPLDLFAEEKPLRVPRGITGAWEEDPWWKEKAKKMGERALAIPETMMALAGGAVTWLPAKVWGTMALPFGESVARMAEEDIASLAYHPYTEEGAKQVEAVGKLFHYGLWPARKVGQALKQRGFPRAGYLLEFAGELAIFKGIHMAGAKAKVAIEKVMAPKPKGFVFLDRNIESRFQKAKGIKEDPILTRVKSTLVDLKNKMTREFEHLPKTGEYAKARFDLLNLLKYKATAYEHAVRKVNEVIKPLSRSEYDLFSRKVILDDLFQTAKEGKPLPYEFNKASLDVEFTRTNNAIANSPQIVAALKQRTSLWNEVKGAYSKAMQDIGLDVADKLTRKNYFRHQVLEYASLKSPVGTGKTLRTPDYRGFLKKRKGSELDINSNYMQAEHEVIAQMFHDIKVAETIKTVDVNHNIVGDLKEKAFARRKAAEILEAELLYHGASKTGAKVIESTGVLGGHIEPTFLTPDLRAAQAHATAKGGKVFAIKKSDVPPELLEGIETGPVALPSKQHWDIRIPIKEYRPKDLDLTWQDLIPETHIVWQPKKGNVFYLADSIPAKLAEQLTSGKLEEIGITIKDLHEVLAIGGKRKQFVIPTELGKTLDNITKARSDNPLIKAHRHAIRGWKVWQLISPRRWFKYNTRNLTGDADGAFAGNPSGFRKVPRAVQDLHEVFIGDKPLTGEMYEWFNRGGVGSTLQAQEMGQFREFSTLKRFRDQSKAKTFTEIPLDSWKKYWKTARLTTDFRESTLRHANYLDYLEQMKRTPDGLPRNYGASIPQEIKGLKDIRDRAYWLSNDLLGAYDRVGLMGQALRESFFPFWSWKEVNFRRYKQMFKNAAMDKNLSKTVGRKLIGTIATTPFKAMRIGMFAIKATAFWAVIQAWNKTRFPKEEKELPQEIRNRPHVILGKDEEGNIEYFSRIGALPDLLEWFDLDAAPYYIDKISKGHMSLAEAAKEMAKQPANIIIQGGMPFVKVAGEMITRRALFPNIYEPRTVRDRFLHLFRSFGLENEYLAISDKPSRPYLESVQGLYAYKIDPLEAGYRDTLDEKKRFMKKLGKFGEGFWLSPKGNALYNARLALRYKDSKAAVEYMADYLKMGGTMQGLNQSLERMEPLAGMNEDEKLIFLSQLDQEGRNRLIRAYRFYADLLTAKLEE